MCGPETLTIPPSCSRGNCASGRANVVFRKVRQKSATEMLHVSAESCLQRAGTGCIAVRSSALFPFQPSLLLLSTASSFYLTPSLWSSSSLSWLFFLSSPPSLLPFLLLSFFLSSIQPFFLSLFPPSLLPHRSPTPSGPRLCTGHQWNSRPGRHAPAS